VLKKKGQERTVLLDDPHRVGLLRYFLRHYRRAIGHGSSR
jgi:hypothetical protein